MEILVINNKDYVRIELPLNENSNLAMDKFSHAYVLKSEAYPEEKKHFTEEFIHAVENRLLELCLTGKSQFSEPNVIVHLYHNEMRCTFEGYRPKTIPAGKENWHFKYHEGKDLVTVTNVKPIKFGINKGEEMVYINKIIILSPDGNLIKRILLDREVKLRTGNEYVLMPGRLLIEH